MVHKRVCALLDHLGDGLEVADDVREGMSDVAGVETANGMVGGRSNVAGNTAGLLVKVGAAVVESRNAAAREIQPVARPREDLARGDGPVAAVDHGQDGVAVANVIKDDLAERRHAVRVVERLGGDDLAHELGHELARGVRVTQAREVAPGGVIAAHGRPTIRSKNQVKDAREWDALLARTNPATLDSVHVEGGEPAAQPVLRLDCGARLRRGRDGDEVGQVG